MYIGFQDFKIRCIIGMLPHERVNPQDIFIDLKVQINNRSDWDKIEKTVSYVDLAALCNEWAIKNQYELVEQLAEDLLQQIMQLFPVNWAFIRVKKPAALPAASYAFVEMERDER